MLRLPADVEHVGQHFAGVAGVDDAVVPEAGGAVERGGLRVQFLGRALLQHVEHLFVRFQAVGALFGFGDDAQHGAGLLAAHHRHLGVGPGEDEARVQAAAAHGVVAGAVGAAHENGNFRYPGVGHRLDHFRTVLDDPVLLRVRADHETGGVVEKQ